MKLVGRGELSIDNEDNEDNRRSPMDFLIRSFLKELFLPLSDDTSCWSADKKCGDSLISCNNSIVVKPSRRSESFSKLLIKARVNEYGPGPRAVMLKGVDPMNS